MRGRWRGEGAYEDEGGVLKCQLRLWVSILEKALSLEFGRTVVKDHCFLVKPRYRSWESPAPFGVVLRMAMVGCLEDGGVLDIDVLVRVELKSRDRVSRLSIA